jgi:hypothetical protein
LYAIAEHPANPGRRRPAENLVQVSGKFMILQMQMAIE